MMSRRARIIIIVQISNSIIRDIYISSPVKIFSLSYTLSSKVRAGNNVNYSSNSKTTIIAWFGRKCPNKLNIIIHFYISFFLVLSLPPKWLKKLKISNFKSVFPILVKIERFTAGENSLLQIFCCVDQFRLICMSFILSADMFHSS